VPPQDSWGPGASLDAIHVHRRGSPAKLARDVEAYIARHAPPVARDPLARTKGLPNHLVLPILIVAALISVYVWCQLK